MFALLFVFALAYSASAQLPTDCGVPAIRPTLAGSKIVSNTEAIPNSWPWQVQMRYTGSHFCGGSVIAPGWVLSAAHCVYNRPVASFSFRAGRHTRTGTSDANEQISAASQIIAHENYNSATINNDVTVIRLQTPFTLNDYVNNVCLTSTEPEAGTDVWVTGWGNVQGTCCDGQLKQAKLPIISRTACQNSWGSNFVITDGMVCAGTGYPSACNGDSGGPLVLLSGANKFIQVGIVSWGPTGCRSATLPSGYTNVAKYKPWILNKIETVEKEEALFSGKFHPRLGAGFRSVAQSLEN